MYYVKIILLQTYASIFAQCLRVFQVAAIT